MPAADPLKVHCQQALKDIITISQRINCSALICANSQEDPQYFNHIATLRHQLGTIRGHAEVILEVITLQNRNIDERTTTWLFSGGLPTCLDKLKEMDDIFDPRRPAVTPTLPLKPGANNIARAMALFEQHTELFHFLLTPKACNVEGHPQQSSQLPQAHAHLNVQETLQDVRETTAQSSTESDREHGENLSQLKADQEATRQRAFLSQKLDEVLRWLAALDCTDKHNETLEQRQQGTCMWFPGVGAFKAWKSSSSPFLWVHGKGGCGKSVLVASTIEYLRSTPEVGDVLAYYYCDFRNERSTSPTEVMRSLLSQLFRHLRDCGVEAGALPNRILEEKSDGTLTLSDLDQMAHLVLRAAGRFPRPPMILIDALDECMEIEKLLPALALLIHPDIRLLVTTRPLQIFENYFGKHPSLSFHATRKELAADIGLHIAQELDSHVQLRSADPKLKRQVLEKLYEQADGRFRWVQCQLDILKRCSSRQELQDVLNNLPGELETTYERILSKIDERTSEAKLVRRALVWLIAALVPLRLTQLLDGLSFDPRERKIQRSTQSLGPALLDALSSLVLYNKETDVLTLSHLTVKEYLTRCTALPMYHIIPHEAHIEVTEMCMCYITSLLKQVRFRAALAISESSPMLSYVFSTGLNHLAYVDPASSVALDVLQSFASEVNHRPSHWDLLCEMREENPRRFYPPWPSSRHDVVLYTLIAYSPVSLLELFLSRNCSLKPRPGTNPLVYAADLWKTTHAITLLRNNIDATAPGLVVDDSRHALPLEVAIDLGNDILVGELLQKGSVVTSELLSTAVCMPWCSTRVLVKLAQTDAFAEWAHEIGDEDLYPAIFNSARPNAGDSRQADRDHVLLARRLRDVGQDLAPNTPFGAELVKRALHSAHISMLEFLLPPDQPPPAHFLIAACTGNTPETVSVVRFLLDKKVNTRAVTRGRRDTVLHLAVMSPWEPRALELTKMLLDAGCNPSAQNREKDTPLIIAVGRRYTTVVALLVSKGADVHSTTIDGNTVLHLAVTHYEESFCLNLIKIFIEAGCDPTSYGARCRTVLDVAIERNYTSVVDHLLSYGVPLPPDILPTSLQHRLIRSSKFATFLVSKGADVHSTTTDGDTVLHLAATYHEESLCLDLIKIFIGAGCDPTSYGAWHRTVLDVAIERNHTSVVDYLLSYGVPLPPDILSTSLQLRLIRSSEVATLLVSKGADVHSTRTDGDTVLHLATAHYEESLCLDLIKIFIGAGCDPTSYGAWRVLDIAIAKSYTSVVDHLLSYGVPLPPDILSTSLQHQLIQSSEVATLLVSKGADVHSTMTDGDTVLHLAVTHYKESLCLDLIKIFIEAGCDPTSYGARHRTVLDVAIERSYTSVVGHLLSYSSVLLPPDILSTSLQHRLIRSSKVAMSLVSKGADVHSTTIDGNTVLHLAVTHYEESFCLNLIKIFIEAGCDPTSYGARRRTVLDVAIERSYTSVVDHLLSYGVPLPPDILSTSLRHQLIHSSKVATFLVGKGADVHSTTTDGDTVLHLAMTHYEESFCLDLIKIFIEAGCDPTSHGARHRTALDVAIERSYTSVVGHLLSYGVPLPPDILSTALQSPPLAPSPQVIRRLVVQGADMRFLTSQGETVFDLAMRNYAPPINLKVISIFSEAGYNPIPFSPIGIKILETAIHCGSTFLVDLLLPYDIQFPPNILPTALQGRWDAQLIIILAQKGADVHSTSDSGETVFHLAITEYIEPVCLRLVKAFITAGCIPARCNSDGLSALEAAIKYGYTHVVKLLLSHAVSLPPHILLTALRLHTTPEMMELLVCHGADANIITLDGNNLLRVLQTSYSKPNGHQRIIEILQNARGVKRNNTDSGDVAHVTEQPRLQ